MSKYYLGIDPGLSGALSFYDPRTCELIVHDMPTYVVKSGKTKKRAIDVYALARIIDGFGKEVIMAVIEEVGAMPGQGVTSMFSFGFSVGCVHMMVASAFIPMVTVRPAKWKKEMGLTHDKDGARREATRLLPRDAGQWVRKMDDGRAESALLAYYLAKREGAILTIEDMF